MSFTEGSSMPDISSQPHSLAKLRNNAHKNKHYSAAAGDEIDLMIDDLKSDENKSSSKEA